MREITEVFEVKGRLSESSLLRYSCVSDQYLFQEKFATFDIDDVNAFLPTVSCLSFPSSCSPLLLHPSPDVETAHCFSFSNSFACPGDTTPSLNLYFTRSFRLPQGYAAARFSFAPHHLSLSDTNLLSSLS